MAVPKRKTWFAGFENLYWLETDDGSRTLWDGTLEETFHSGCGAVAESWFVYLYNSGILHRLKRKADTRVMEFGLGTATAFLLTAAVADANCAGLSYLALEKSLLPVELISQLPLAESLDRWWRLNDQRETPAPCTLPDHLFKATLESLSKLQKRLVSELRTQKAHSETGGIRAYELSEFVRLGLWLGDAREFPMAGDRNRLDLYLPCHAVYFDPFSPATNPDLWKLPVYQMAYSCLLPEGCLASYCVKGSVRQIWRRLVSRSHENPGRPAESGKS